MSYELREMPSRKAKLIIFTILEFAEIGGMIQEDCGAVMVSLQNCLDNVGDDVEEVMGKLICQIQQIINAEKWEFGDELKATDNQRARFRARVSTFGEKKKFKIDYTKKKNNRSRYFDKIIYLIEVVFAASGKPVTDQVWFMVGQTIDQLGLKEDDVIEFDARMNSYTKGDVDNRDIDYSLSRPTKFKITNRGKSH